MIKSYKAQIRGHATNPLLMYTNCTYSTLWKKSKSNSLQHTDPQYVISFITAFVCRWSMCVPVRECILLRGTYTHMWLMSTGQQHPLSGLMIHKLPLTSPIRSVRKTGREKIPQEITSSSSWNTRKSVWDPLAHLQPFTHMYIHAFVHIHVCTHAHTSCLKSEICTGRSNTALPSTSI